MTIFFPILSPRAGTQTCPRSPCIHPSPPCPEQHHGTARGSKCGRPMWGAGWKSAAKPHQSNRELLTAGTGGQEGKAPFPAGEGARRDPVNARLSPINAHPLYEIQSPVPGHVHVLQRTSLSCLRDPTTALLHTSGGVFGAVITLLNKIYIALVAATGVREAEAASKRATAVGEKLSCCFH